MIKVYDDDDNIVVDSKHNAEMISAYLTNVSIEYAGYLSDECVKILEKADTILWFLSDKMPEE